MSLRKTISYLLFPLTCWYAVGVAVRNILYETGIKKQHAPHITTIGVGNLSTGGSGKTPHVEYLLDMLSGNYRTAVLSRGYKRKSKGFQLDDGSHDAARLGDESAMIAAKYPQVQVAVCEKRIEGVRRLMELHADTPSSESDNGQKDNQAPELIILDDVFQHRRIKPSINILLTEYRQPFYSDYILPYGDLREFRSARRRASIVVVTKCPAKLNPVERHNIVQALHLQCYQKVFFSYLAYGPLRPLNGTARTLDLRRTDCVLAVTGIAHPGPMIEELRRNCKVQHMAFADHHNYTSCDMARIRETFDSMSGHRKAIVTTEKDAMRLQGKCDDLPVYIQPVAVKFHQDKDINFDQIVESAVRENISFLSNLKSWT